MSRISPRTMRQRIRSGSVPESMVQEPKPPKSPSKRIDDTLTTAQKEHGTLPKTKNKSLILDSLLRSPKYSDLKVVCDTRIWQCQRSILTQRCTFFAAALTPGFNEAEKSTIELPEDDADAVDVMLLYIYTLQRPDFSDEQLFPTPSLTATSVFKLADKYDLPDLRLAAKDYFLGLIRSSLTQWHSLNSQNRGLWMAWIPIFWEWSMEGADEIREAIIDAIVKTAKSMCEDMSFQRVLSGDPDIAMTLIKALAAKAKAK